MIFRQSKYLKLHSLIDVSCFLPSLVSWLILSADVTHILAPFQRGKGRYDNKASHTQGWKSLVYLCHEHCYK